LAGRVLEFSGSRQDDLVQRWLFSGLSLPEFDMQEGLNQKIFNGKINSGIFTYLCG